MGSKSKNIFRMIGLVVFFALGITILSPYIAKIPESINAIQNLDFGDLGLAVLCEFLRFLGYAVLINAILGLFKDHVSIWQALMIILASASFGMIAGGMAGSIAASIQWLHERKVKLQAATVASILQNLLNNIAIFLLSLLGVAYLRSMDALTKPQWNAVLIILCMLVVVLVFSGLFLTKREKSIGFLISVIQWVSKILKKEIDEGKIREQIGEVYEVWDVVLRKKWWRPLLGLSMSFLFDILALYFFFLSAGQPLSFTTLIIGYGLPQLLGKAAFVLPGGIGVVESSMIDLYQKMGISSSVSVIVVLAYRLIAFIIPTLLGFLFVFSLQRVFHKKESVNLR